MRKKTEKITVEWVATRGGFVQLLEPTLKPTSIIREKLGLGETGKLIKAVEKPNTIFTHWSDRVKANPRTYTVTEEDYKNGYVQIIANFSCKYWFIGKLFDWIWSRRMPRR